MNQIITNYCFQKTVAATIFVSSITLLILSLIGIIAGDYPCNVFRNFSSFSCGCFLSISSTLFILNLFWIFKLKNKSKREPLSEDPPPLQILPDMIKKKFTIDSLSSEDNRDKHTAIPENHSPQIWPSDTTILTPTTLGESRLNYLIFSYLDIESACECFELPIWEDNCALDFWKDKDLTKEYPFLTIFDQEDWERCFNLPEKIQFDDIKPLNKRLLVLEIKKYKSLFPSCIISPCTLLTMPKNLSMDHIISLSQRPKRGFSGTFFSGHLHDPYENQKISNSYRVLLSHRALHQTRGNWDFAAKKIADLGGILPSCIELSTLVLTMCVESRGYLFSTLTLPFNYSYCKQKEGQKEKFKFGGRSLPPYRSIGYHFSEFSLYDREGAAIALHI